MLIATGGDDCQLPYASGGFDVVICNLVLEWCAARGQKVRAELGQRQFLSDMFRVLKRGGSLWVNTKNRFSLRILFDDSKGCTDDGKRTGRLRKVVLSLAGKNRNDGLTHSYNKFTAMLSTCRVSGLAVLLGDTRNALPSRFYSDGSRFSESGAADWQSSSRRHTLYSVVDAFRTALWVKQVMPGLTFLAKKI